MEEPAQSPSPPPSDPDAALVGRAQGGDYAAFEQLVARHERGIYALARRIVHNEADADEVVQETFLSVVEHLAEFRGESMFRTWLIRVATNHALKVLRRRKARPTTQIAEESPLPHPVFIAPWKENPQQLAQRNEVARLLEEAMNDLDEKYRLVFVLRDVEGLSTEEAAAALGITESNAKVRLLRARLMLREKLTRVLGDETKRIVGDHDHEHG